jgi:ribonuclease HI
MTTFYTDGGTANNGLYGHQRSVICVADGFGDCVIWEEIGDKTNNEAELIAILRCLEEWNLPCEIISDSQLAVNIINGKWKAKKPHLRALRDQILNLNRADYSLIWKPREENLAGFIIEERLGL